MQGKDLAKRRVKKIVEKTCRHLGILVPAPRAAGHFSPGARVRSVFLAWFSTMGQRSGDSLLVPFTVERLYGKEFVTARDTAVGREA